MYKIRLQHAHGVLSELRPLAVDNAAEAYDHCRCLIARADDVEAVLLYAGGKRLHSVKAAKAAQVQEGGGTSRAVLRDIEPERLERPVWSPAIPQKLGKIDRTKPETQQPKKPMNAAPQA